MPRRRSLVVRLMATSIVIALTSIVATAWLTVHTTTAAVNDQRVRPIADQTHVYDALVGYAATHPTWTGVAATVTQLSRSLDQRVTLLTPARKVIADSDPDGPRLAVSQQSATIDALHIPGSSGSTTDADTASSGIDPRAVGPYLLPASERERLERAAHQVLQCMGDKGGVGETVHVVVTPSGRPTLAPVAAVGVSCIPPTLLLPTPTEATALKKLLGLTDDCMHRRVSTYIEIGPSFQVAVANGPLPEGVTFAHVLRCVTSARRTQLAPYVAPAAILAVTDLRGDPATRRFTLTGANTLRVLAGTALILLAAVAATVLAGRRLVRPLRQLAEHAEQPIDQQRPVPIRAGDEIGQLAEALNDHLARRREAEQHRQAIVNDVAHELRTPLSNILSWIEAAQDGVAATDAELLTLLHEEAELLQHVVDDLRDLAAADAGTLRIFPELTCLDDALTAIVEAHQGMAQQAGVTLTAEPGADVQLWIDPVRFRQLVGNLVTNAITHTVPGGHVTIRTRGTSEHVEVDVVDDGLGIASADLDRVFDRFWRADASRSRATGGSGLGLSIVRRLVEAHGGDVSIASEVGVGSTFTVRLPLSRP